MKPEKYGIAYDVERDPAHRRERVGKVCFNRALARDEGKLRCSLLNC